MGFKLNVDLFYRVNLSKLRTKQNYRIARASYLGQIFRQKFFSFKSN